MAELVDALVSGTSGGDPWKFESSYAHHRFSLLRAKRTIKKIECLAVARWSFGKKLWVCGEGGQHR